MKVTLGTPGGCQNLPMRRTLALLLLLASTAAACSTAGAREGFCADAQSVLAAPLHADLTTEAGVTEYRDRMRQVVSLAGQLPADDRATLEPALDGLLTELDASVARIGSPDGWSSDGVFEILWEWCGSDVGNSSTVQS